jgi:hypothetical protein
MYTYIYIYMYMYTNIQKYVGPATKQQKVITPRGGSVSARIRSSNDSPSAHSNPSLASPIKSLPAPSYTSNTSSRERVKSTARPPVPEWRDSSIFNDTEPLENFDNPHSNSKHLSPRKSKSADNITPHQIFPVEEKVVEREEKVLESMMVEEKEGTVVETNLLENNNEKEIDDPLPGAVPAPSRLSSIGGIIKNLFVKNTSPTNADVDRRQSGDSFTSIATDSSMSALEFEKVTMNSLALEESKEGKGLSRITCKIDSFDDEDASVSIASLSVASDSDNTLTHKNSLDSSDMLSEISKTQGPKKGGKEKVSSNEERHMEKLKNRLKSATSKPSISPTVIGGGSMRQNSAFNSSRIK